MAAPFEKSKPKVLIVDDDRHARTALSSFLDIEGFAVITAKNGLDGLNQLKTESHVSLILLDLRMPVMDGWEFLRRKSEVASIAEIPVIAVSALPSGSLDGAQTVFQKPVIPRLLVDAIRRYLR